MDYSLSYSDGSHIEQKQDCSCKKTEIKEPTCEERNTKVVSNDWLKIDESKLSEKAVQHLKGKMRKLSTNDTLYVDHIGSFNRSFKEETDSDGVARRKVQDGYIILLIPPVKEADVKIIKDLYIVSEGKLVSLTDCTNINISRYYRVRSPHKSLLINDVIDENKTSITFETPKYKPLYAIIYKNKHRWTVLQKRHMPKVEDTYLKFILSEEEAKLNISNTRINRKIREEAINSVVKGFTSYKKSSKCRKLVFGIAKVYQNKYNTNKIVDILRTFSVTEPYIPIRNDSEE